MMASTGGLLRSQLREGLLCVEAGRRASGAQVESEKGEWISVKEGLWGSSEP